MTPRYSPTGYPPTRRVAGNSPNILLELSFLKLHGFLLQVCNPALYIVVDSVIDTK